MLEILENSGANLLKSMAFNSKTIIEGGMLLEDAVRDGFARSISNIQDAASGNHLNEDYLASQVWAANADGAIVLNKKKIVSLYPNKAVPLSKFVVESMESLLTVGEELKEDEFETFTVAGYKDDYVTFVGGSDSLGNKYFLFKIGALIVPGWQDISIKNLIDNISREPGIEYLLLQNYDGIVFASRRVERMPSIEDDPFLQKSLEDSMAASRITQFYGKDVLEVAESFYSQGSFNGIFRLGLSLDLYHELTHDYQNRIYILSGIMILLIFLLLGVTFLYQRKILAAESLQHARNVYDQILSQIPSGVLEIDGEGAILALNAAGEKILGLNANKIIGHSYYEVFKKDILDFENVGIGSTASKEVELIRERHEKRIITAVFSRIDDSTIGKQSNLIVFYDITKLKTLEEQARRHQRLKELGDMSAGVAHEIRNPLNAISIAVQRLKEELVVDPSTDANSLLEHLSTETQRLNRIVEDFLLLARYKYQTGSCDLLEVIRGLIGILSPQAEKANVRFQYDIPSGIEVMLSAEDLKKVLINLLVNAMQSCQEGGDVSISAAAHSDDKIRIEVSDTGAGIPEELAGVIFEPYISGKKGGAGLGLAITARIINDAGGSIQATNRPEGGAIFTLILPGNQQSNVSV